MSKTRYSLRKSSSNPVSKKSVQEKKSSASFENFIQMYCESENAQVPKIIVCSKEPSYGALPNQSFETSSTLSTNIKSLKNKELYDLLAIYDHPDSPNLLHSIVIKNFRCNRIMNMFHEICFLYPSLTMLRLEFCSLTADNIVILHDLLQKNEKIIELSLDGNPNTRNLHTVLDKTYLQSLSLKYCSLDDDSISLLVRTAKEGIPLQFLVLNGNNITDNGIESIAFLLRDNRKLIYLGLAANQITNDGCKILMDVLQLFPLWHEEIVCRRRKNMEILKIKKAIDELRKGREKDSMSKRHSACSSKRNSIASVKKINKRSGSALVATQHSESFLAEIESHPYMTECFKAEKQVFCKGNFVLHSINLAYNKITVDGAQYILDMLEYQRSHDNGNNYIGVQRILLEGNEIPEHCQEMLIIQAILCNPKMDGFSPDLKSIGSRQKRRSSSKTISTIMNN